MTSEVPKKNFDGGLVLGCGLGAYAVATASSPLIKAAGYVMSLFCLHRLGQEHVPSVESVFGHAQEGHALVNTFQRVDKKFSCTWKATR